MTRLRPVRIAGAALLVAVCGASSPVRALQKGHWWDAATFSVGKGAKRVTVAKDGVTLATIAVPDGVVVSIYSDRPASHGPKETYHGRSEIRVRSAAGIPPMTEMESAMARAPVVISVADGDVTLETSSR